MLRTHPPRYGFLSNFGCKRHINLPYLLVPVVVQNTLTHTHTMKALEEDAAASLAGVHMSVTSFPVFFLSPVLVLNFTICF